MGITKKHIAFLIILQILAYQARTEPLATKSSYLVDDTVYFIYQKTLEVNKLLEDGEIHNVISKANSVIDSFPHLILQTPYFGYLNYYKGSAYRSTGNYYLSEKCYQLASNCLSKRNDIETYISSQNNLAISLMESRKYNQAVALLDNLLLQLPGSISSNNISNIYGNLAALGLRMNDTALCNKSFKKIFQLNGRNSRGEYAHFIAERNYGRYLIRQNRYKESEKYLLNALMGSIDSLGLNHIQTGLCYRHLGELFSSMGNPDSALQYYSKAMKILEDREANKSPGPDPQYETVYIECLMEIGELQLGMDSLVSGLNLFEKAIDRLQFLSHSVNTETSRFIIAEKGRIVYNKAVSTALRLFDATGDQKHLHIAFEWSLQAKSFSLNWLTEKDLIYKRLNMPAGLVGDLKEIRQKLNTEFSKLSSDDEGDNLFDLSQLIREYEKGEQILAKNYPEIQKEKQNLNYQNLIRKSLGRNEKYLGYYDTGDQLFVFILSPKSLKKMNITREDKITAEIERFKSIVSISPNANYSREDVQEYSKLSNSLYGTLIAPYITKNDKILAIHPDGCLLDLPFEAFTSQKMTGDTFSQLPYLIKSMEIRYVATPFLIEHPDKIKNKKSGLTVVSCSQAEGAELIKTESSDIQKIFPKSDIVFLDEQTFVPGLLNKTDKIHISGHLHVDRANAVGTGFSCKSFDNTDLLTFQDILYLDLSGSRVFINACESGSGPLNQGEGLMSMGLAFAMAGSNSIIQHFWEAPDLGAYEISLEYYKQLKWKNPSRSLNVSKRKYLEDCLPGYDHPFYWAGIIYYGDRSGTNKSNFFYPFFAILGIAATVLIALVIRRFKPWR